ncbi:hypothetical protein QCA50_011894 [Cerrena zonata]|uniref:Uncharacterized protein n=1 Tax=Cerrena zonata TaxID=2478898 RepID=A0AAW0FXY7_9APHY
MNNIFSSNRLLPNFKRRPRTRSKQDVTSPAKAKPLHILPGLTEEDESRSSTSSTSSSPSSYTSPYCASRSAGGNATLGGRNSQAFDILDIKRESRRVVLVGAEGLTFDDFFPASDAPPRPAPRPPVQNSRSSMESPLDEINLRFSGLGISLDFPSPPSKSSSMSRREPSPTPSDSSATTATSSSSSRTPLTPPTSDDESQPRTHLARAPTYKSQRASILYMKSMPDLKKRSLPQTPVVQDSEDDWSDGEDASWFAQDISDIFTLSSPLSTATPTSKSFEHKARPDSIPPPSRHAGRSRASKLPPIAPLTIQTHGRGPSTQLDPSFPPNAITSIANKRRSRFIPSRPPPPPPITIEPASCPSPTMEEKTEELLKLLADAALDNTFLGTGLSVETEMLSTPVTPSSLYAISTPTTARPPPRMSIPADIFDFTEESPETDVSESGFDIIVTQPEDDVPGSPRSISIYSQASMSVDALPISPISSFDFDIRTPTASEDPTAGMYPSQFSSFTTAAADIASPSPTTSANDFDSASMIRERNLRSRWSSSTLASEYHAHHRQQMPLSPSAWITRFHLGSSSSSSSPTKSKAPKPTKAVPAAKVPLSPATKKSLDLEGGAGLTRRDSSSSSRTSSSDSSSDSGESISSNGLRRKAIPIELFLRS